jgi:hypothetical protein
MDIFSRRDCCKEDFLGCFKIHGAFGGILRVLIAETVN